MKPSPLNSTLIAALAAVTIWTSGCSTTPKARTIVFRKTPEVSHTIAVDVVAVSKQDIANWRSLDITKYFNTDNNPRRTTARSNGLLLERDWRTGEELKLERRDPLWDQWFGKGVQYVVILADLPRKDLGQQESRRNEIDLTDRAYKGRKARIVVEVSAAQVSVHAEKR